MRRTVAAVVLAGLVSLTTMVPSASAQIPGLESWGFSGNTPFFSTSLFGPGPVQCQFGGFVNAAGVGGGVAGVGVGNVTPFFTASAAGPVPPIPGPCTPPPFLLGGLGGLGGLGVGGLGVGGVGAGGISSLTLAQALGLGIGTTTTVGCVTSFTIAGQTRALGAGQTLSNTTVGTLFPNLGAGAGFGLGGVGGFGLNTGLLGGTGLGLTAGLGGLGGLTGLGGLNGLGGLTGLGGVTGTGTVNVGGRTCTVQGAFLVC
jgi:hypothetical protein